MYIKKLTICGFKSFGEELTIDSFNDESNVLIGNKGGGKSSVLEAISFALNINEDYENFTQDDFQTLIHKSDGSPVTSAFVEIVIEWNGDNQVSALDTPEVKIKRVIDPEDITYYRDDVKVERIEIKNFLQMMGFSKAYPFYFYVKQNDVQSLATANDVDRLTLVKKVAGLDDFLKSKEKSMRILIETEDELTKVAGCLEKIDTQLSICEMEPSQSEYNQALEKRQAIENRKKLLEDEEAEKSIENVQNEIANAHESKAQLFGVIKELDENIKALRQKARIIASGISKLQTDKRKMSEQQALYEKKHSEMEIELSSVDEQYKAESDGHSHAKQELEFLKVSIDSKIREVNALKVKCEKFSRNDTELMREKELFSNECKRIYLGSNQGQRLGYNFGSKNERDAWITSEVNEINKKLKAENIRLKRFVVGAEREQNIENLLRKELEEQTLELERLGVLENIKQQLDDASKQLETLENRKQVLADENTELKDLFELSKLDLQICKAKLDLLGDKSDIVGLETMKMLMKKKSNSTLAEQSHGTVMDIIQCDPTDYKGIEHLACDYLFHQIVESADVANEWLKLMNADGLPGEVNFIALNQLQVDIEKITAEMNVDTWSLISKLTFDEKFKPIVYWIFSQYEISDDFNAAIIRSQNHSKGCITFDGEMITNDGAITAGFDISEESVLDVYIQMKNLHETVDYAKNRIVILEDELKNTETALFDTLAEVQKNKGNLMLASDLNTKISMKSQKLRSVEQSHKAKLAAKQATERQIRTLQDQKTGIEAELQKPMLTEQEENNVDLIQYLINDLHEEISVNKVDQGKWSKKFEQTNAFLQNHLLARQDQLLQIIASNDRLYERIKTYEMQLEDYESTMSKADSLVNDINAKIGDLTAQQNELKNQAMECNQKKKRTFTELSEIDVKLSGLNQHEEELRKKIRPESSQPLTANGTNSSIYGMTSEELSTEMVNTEQQLMSYEQNNYDRLQKLASFRTEKDELYARKIELESHDGKIRKLMLDLEMENDKSVRETFTRLSDEFSTVFREFYPEGCAILALVQSEEVDKDCAAADANANQENNFTGVAISVSIDSNSPENAVDFMSLSETEKKVVSVALILAIQQCEPAPFYLYDCIEEAIPENLRPKLLTLINGRHYILASNTAEYLQHVKNIYQVYSENGMSAVKAITLDEANRLFAQCSN